MPMTDREFSALMASLKTMELGVRCATRIAEMEVRPELGVTSTTKLLAISEVLRVSQARADGDEGATLSEEAMAVMKVVQADVEVRLLYDRLGLKTWRSR